MRKIFVIGIGVGDPDHMTVQAIKALNQASVFFIPDKGAEKAALARSPYRDLRALHRKAGLPDCRGRCAAAGELWRLSRRR